jgi:F0F1-type ATP synthase assembly protein I
LVRGARFLGVGFEFAGTVVAGVIAGSYLDDYLGTNPWLTLLLTVGAMAGAIYRLVWMLKRFGPQSDDGGS